MRIIIKENQYFKLMEENTNDVVPDFNKLVYNPEDKSMVGAYMVTGDNGKMIDVLNIREELDRAGLFLDGAESYNIDIRFSKLPKSQIEILGPVEGKEGFDYIKIPYWLYKKMPEELNIKRYADLKRLSIARSQVNQYFFKLINNPDVERYFKIIDTDDISQKRYKMYQKYYKS
jgi:hypothetical protein